MSKEGQFDLRQLRQNPRNPFPFKGTDEQWEKFTGNLVENVEYLEAINIVYDSTQDNLIIAGNKRQKGLIENDIFFVSQRSVLDCKDWSEEKRHEFIVASNKNWGTWDEAFVMEDFKELAFDYDISFESEESADVNIDDIETKDGFDLPEGDREPFQQMTFTLADEQAKRIKEAIAGMKKTDNYKFAETFGNENGNGNALYLLVTESNGQR